MWILCACLHCASHVTNRAKNVFKGSLCNQSTVIDKGISKILFVEQWKCNIYQCHLTFKSNLLLFMVIWEEKT